MLKNIGNETVARAVLYRRRWSANLARLSARIRSSCPTIASGPIPALGVLFGRSCLPWGGFDAAKW